MAAVSLSGLRREFSVAAGLVSGRGLWSRLGGVIVCFRLAFFHFTMSIFFAVCVLGILFVVSGIVGGLLVLDDDGDAAVFGGIRLFQIQRTLVGEAANLLDLIRAHTGEGHMPPGCIGAVCREFPIGIVAYS